MHRHITKDRRPDSTMLAIRASQFGSQASRGQNISRFAVPATSANRRQRGLRRVRAPAAAGQRPQTRSCPPGAATGWAQRPRLQPARPAPPRRRRPPRPGCHPQRRWGRRPRRRWGCRPRTCWGCHPPAGARSGGCWPSSRAASSGAAAHRTPPLLLSGVKCHGGACLLQEVSRATGLAVRQRRACDQAAVGSRCACWRSCAARLRRASEPVVSCRAFTRCA